MIENSFPIATKLNKRNTMKKAKSISVFDFNTFYTTILHNLLIKVLCKVINFVFKSETRSRISFSKILVYWASKGCGRRYFTRQTLIDAISFLITKCYFTTGRLVFKQEIGIRLSFQKKDIDPARNWANLFLYFLNPNIFSN